MSDETKGWMIKSSLPDPASDLEEIGGRGSSALGHIHNFLCELEAYGYEPDEIVFCKSFEQGKISLQSRAEGADATWRVTVSTIIGNNDVYSLQKPLDEVIQHAEMKVLDLTRRFYTRMRVETDAPRPLPHSTYTRGSSVTLVTHACWTDAGGELHVVPAGTKALVSGPHSDDCIYLDLEEPDRSVVVCIEQIHPS